MKVGAYYTALDRSNVKNEDRIFLQWPVKIYLKEYKIYVK